MRRIEEKEAELEALAQKVFNEVKLRERELPLHLVASAFVLYVEYEVYKMNRRHRKMFFGFAMRSLILAALLAAAMIFQTTAP